MTHLRKIMPEELQRRHYSEGTTRYYIHHVERFARHFNCSPDRLGPQHIRKYQAYLFTKLRLSPGHPPRIAGKNSRSFPLAPIIDYH